ncbi:rhomboid family intramembrane serine protease [bacterium]|nr:rhomboid family intramembrane serine protease [bacterium]
MLILPFRSLSTQRRAPWVNYLLVLGNVAAFAYACTLGSYQRELFFTRYALSPALLFRIHSDYPFLPVGAFGSLFSSMFLHASVLHLAGNLLYLWVFGSEVEERLGHFRFLAFYLVCGMIATLTWAVLHRGSSAHLVGASGAIAGVLGAYLWWFPLRRIHCFVWIVILVFRAEIHAVFFLAYWLALQLAYSYLEVLSLLPRHEPVAWTAHVGGFAAGMALAVAATLRRR